ncbi:serine/threonine protein kinase [Variovorax sp. JS1663]|uniref:serine/threonine protein kinase n=1 Tax=Variovorax sp. JS1663 TaxID=1851577 RepID=UPI000B3485F6|nr:serine/threonine protein kinase [Variovorax sp. JS1663]OUM04024.1 serine/threonine protein kinase [Variovorax sp. JS1663]
MPALLALSCPQCSAPLPRAARWRTVECAYCGATVVRGEETVRREDFRAALRRAQQAHEGGRRLLQWRGAHYRVLAPLGRGEHAEVLLAERLGALPERVTLKLALDDRGAKALAREAAALGALQSLDVAGAAYFTRRLPQPIGTGLAEGWSEQAREALALRHPTGFWGSLEAVRRNHAQGIDPRHAVWIWRRMLEVLAFVHDAGWCHGALAPEHALVHPRDHGVLLIGWSQARPHADRAMAARDLQQSAWTLRALLHGTADGAAPGLGPRTPGPLATLLHECSENTGACDRLGARGIEAALSDAARAAFGAPQFVHFEPVPPPGT